MAIAKLLFLIIHLQSLSFFSPPPQKSFLYSTWVFPFLPKMPPKILPLLAISMLLHLPFSAPDLASDRAALIALRAAVGGRTLLWNVNQQSPCFWAGVLCESNRVTVLRLPGVALSGDLPVGVLGNLTELRTLSLRLNALTGKVPSDLALCTKLRNLYLQGNQFSGHIPEALFSLSVLVRLNLASNSLTGEIPLSFNNLTRLRTLFLENNRLTGSMPPGLKLQKLRQFNVSNNQLNGSIPDTLQTFETASFLGTSLCGKPLNACPVDINLPPAEPGTESSGSANKGAENNNSNKKQLSGGAVAGLVIGSILGFLLLLVSAIFLCRKTRSRKASRSVDVASFKLPEKEFRAEKPTFEAEKGSNIDASNEYSVTGNGKGAVANPKKLVFFGNYRKVFDLEDLLRASAEVLGKGTSGAAYKAALEAGIVVVVKRLKDVNVSAKEFKEKIEAVGAMDHENLVPLRAYYYCINEKLLVYDYMAMGSLSALLHGNKGAGSTPLNWETRSSIALGAARGVEYIHSQGALVTHGNIKSSNILLTKSYEARVSDFGLAQLVGPSSMPHRVAGYRAPEVTDPQRVSQKADVYSFGVLLLELLTGKAPTHALLNEEGVNLPRWVQSIVREEWNSKVFDRELQHDPSVEDMVRLLQLGINCTAQHPDNRPSMSEVKNQIKEIIHSSGQKV